MSSIKPKNQNKAKKKTSSQLKSVGLSIVSKIDNMLEDYKSQNPFNQNNDLTTNELQQLQKEKDDLPIIIPKNEIIEEKTQKTKNTKSTRPKKTFQLTDVGLIKESKYKKKKDDKVMKDINRQIDDMLKNIDQVDSGDINKQIKELSLLDKQGSDFRALINDIDDYKNQIHEEFDEVQYLIKFADKTHKLIGRHKNVISNIFKGAGLKPKRNYDEYDDDDKKIIDKKNNNVNKKKKSNFDDYDDDDYNGDDYDEPRYVNGYYYRRARKDEEDLNEVFDKLKKINKVKDNLSNIQDDFLGYHSNLKNKIKEMHS